MLGPYSSAEAATAYSALPKRPLITEGSRKGSTAAAAIPLLCMRL